MSDYQSASGYVFKLRLHIDKSAIEEYMDKIYNEFDDKIQLNYEGTLVFFITDEVAAGEGVDFLHIAHNRDLQKAKKMLADADLVIDPDSARWFSTCWYNGADSYMSELSLAAFEQLSAT